MLQRQPSPSTTRRKCSGCQWTGLSGHGWRADCNDFKLAVGTALPPRAAWHWRSVRHQHSHLTAAMRAL
eukprot:2036605-Rhodomonas_salina.5